VLLALAFGAAIYSRADHAPKRTLGLFTSLPILWNEEETVAGHLDSAAPRPWVKAALERRFRLRPLDTLFQLDRVQLLLMAQPRPLSPHENVALDAWVRAGGRLVLLADPMATWPSAFPLGDRRRPQDAVLLSPILAHWGLRLVFDDEQSPALREIAGTNLPVRLAGKLEPVAQNGGSCHLEAAQVVAECRIGAGKALIIADSALLDPDLDGGQAQTVLYGFLDRAFAD
jgi:hypothetical protein